MSLARIHLDVAEQAVIEAPVMQKNENKSNYASIKALQRAAAEFETFIADQSATIPNHALLSRYGERVSTGFVESTVNTVVDKRFGKRPQMRSSRHGAHLMLQTRTRTLDGTPRANFEHWYPGVQPNERTAIAA